MANYRLREEAKVDLERIWFYGLEHWGLEAADTYHAAFFDQVADDRFCIASPLIALT